MNPMIDLEKKVVLLEKKYLNISDERNALIQQQQQLRREYSELEGAYKLMAQQLKELSQTQAKSKKK
jgi:hypothetical protein